MPTRSRRSPGRERPGAEGGRQAEARGERGGGVTLRVRIVSNTIESALGENAAR